MSDWNEKTAVITGAGSGIGAALAQHCAAQGMQVIAADIDQQGLCNTQSDASRPEKIEIYSLDVRSEDAVESFAQHCFSQHSAVNLLFNNAGVLIDGKSWERSIKDWRWNFDVNVMGVVNGIHSFVPKMLSQGSAGKVINTASIGGLLAGGTYLAPYQGTKHAVVAITESLHAELALESAPITAACLCPGDTATGIWESDRLRPSEEHNQLLSDAEQHMHDAVAGMCAAGLTAKQVASETFDAIEKNQFWIFPQDQFKPMLELRMEAIIKEQQPPSADQLLALMLKNSL